MKEKWLRKTVNNDGVEIEYYVTNEMNEKSSLILSMGVWEPASRAFPILTRLADTHCIVLSYRGRGGSDAPKAGFDWQQHASDLAAVLKKEPSNNPVFLGFSKGASYTLGYLSSNIEAAHGIILVDYPAIHSKAEVGYANFWYNMNYNGLELKDYITAQTLDGIENESTYKDFYPALSKASCPVWVFRGTDSNSHIPSNLTDEDVKKYKSFVKDLEIVNFNYSGHMIFDEELGKACTYIQQAL